MKVIMEIIYIVFTKLSLKSSVYFTLKAHPFGLTTFHVLNSHVWLVATVLVQHLECWDLSLVYWDPQLPFIAFHFLAGIYKQGWKEIIWIGVLCKTLLLERSPGSVSSFQWMLSAGIASQRAPAHRGKAGYSWTSADRSKGTCSPTMLHSL
jgi:hypothetical protein